ncbi:iron-containing alcohol dehydrogenase family protein [Stackebrandtia nassauensis]|uniref:3-dehydroquinate synthase n=1 Tax=Stackebrandtia nassauensis (strain DSM 44728 / CIP 108903 / NRRL B-16338 / NBRC 102104 / LLR-40K-21) TaxID=446470 RepID=D3PXY1_STANL|nr:iron-containing alcohol dehydrogenase family protein [Stackebrandtia nassauensis]ADD45310.1 3-dehydroquinate synthase [Stackebrandtia nassauensis DSM 44728]
MPLLARTVTAPLAVEVHAGAVRHLGELLADRRISAGGEVAVVVGPGIGKEAAEQARESLARAEVLTIDAGTHGGALELATKLRSRNFDAVVGIGGGRVIDTVKYAAFRQGLPMVSVATSLANDGIASPTASLDRDGHSISYGAQIPIAVIVDLDFVRRAPARQLSSGVGDALSNLCATADWQLSHTETGEPIDGLAIAMSRGGAESVLRHPGSVGDDTFLATLANALVLGGTAMAVAGTSLPASGACHEIAHAIQERHPTVATHGEQVGMGALFATYLRGDEQLFREMAHAMKRHHLPRIPSDMGLTVDQFAVAVAYAPKTRPGRYTILEHLSLDVSDLRDRITEFCDELS